MTTMDTSKSRRTRACEILITLVAMLIVGNVAAQCTYRGAPWPTMTSFTPANPDAGESIKMQLDPMCTCTMGSAVSVSGHDVYVTGNFADFSGVAVSPPPYIYPFALTPLPAGNYRVHLQLTQNGAMCPEVVTPLVVGDGTAAPIPTPANGRWLLASLIGGFVALALAYKRRRSS
ncbi:MAG: hypothetical protein ABI451_12355 [Dokdonella sp.]